MKKFAERTLPLNPFFRNAFFGCVLALCASLWNGMQAQSLSDSVGVFIPRDEYSISKGPQKYMWVDLKNMVISTMMGSAEFIEVWTDNGHADRPKYFSPDLCAVTPAFEGPVNVYTTQRIPKGNDWDTLYTIDHFMAVNQPEIRIMDLFDSLSTTGKLVFFLADKYSFEPLSERYQIAQPFEVMVFDKDYKLAGKKMCDQQMSLSFNSLRDGCEIKKGYKIALQLLVRDVETDLLIPADEWVHVVE